MSKRDKRLKELFGLNEAEAGSHMFWVTDEDNEIANWLVIAPNEKEAIRKALVSLKDPDLGLEGVSAETLSVFKFDDVEYVGGEHSGWLGFAGKKFSKAGHIIKVKDGDHHKKGEEDSSEE